MTDESLFAAALAIGSPADRAAFLDRACAGDPARRRELDALLAAHGASNVLDRPPADLSRTGAYAHVGSAADGLGRAGVGGRVGAYKLLERVGEGGMGEVWVADQQEPIRRRVALKLIKPGMDSRGVLARFEAERQALAMMDHPNIAKVLDAGTTPDGRPYFVMELVKGTPITDFCDARKLTPEQRLALIVPVCQAIQHAHQKGVIHRDIKPSNVLVELHDDRMVPKVIDFGVAKAVGQQLTEKTLYTGFGALVGTPAYMAPEQATFNALDVDTRADVYALGVLLYELLAGSPPVEPDRLKKAALDEVLRIVRDEEPPRPSQRLSTSEARATIAATRQTDPAKLSKLMRGELDWIVMKALEKDRARRYDTAAALAKDVQRYLAGDAVDACPPTLGYRLRKAYRRNRGALTAAAAAAVVLLLAAGVSVWFGVEATRAKAAADDARADAVEQRNRAEDARMEAVDQGAAAHDALAEAVAQRNAATAANERLRKLAAEQRRTVYDVSMNLAQTAWEGDDPARTFALLRQQVPRPGEEDLRGFEWRYWDRLAHQDLGTARLAGFGDGVGPERGAKLSPDGARVAACVTAPAGGAALKLWDAGTGRDVWSVPVGAADEYFQFLTFSGDGRRIAGCRTVGVGNTAARRRVELSAWDAATGRQVYAGTFPDSYYISQPTLSADGSTAAFMLYGWGTRGGHRLSVIRLPGGEEVFRHPPAGRPSVTTGYPLISPDGRRCAGLTEETPPGGGAPVRVMKVWQVADGREVATIGLPGETDWSGCFSPDGSRIARYVRSVPKGQVAVWDAGTGAKLREFDLHTPAGEFRFDDPMAFDPTGGRLAVANGAQVFVFDLAAGRPAAPAHTVRGHESAVRALAFGAARLVSLDARGLVKQWDPAPRAPRLRAPFGGPLSGFVACPNPDGSRVAVAASHDRPSDTFRLTDGAGRPVGESTLPRGGGDGAFSANGRTFALCWHEEPFGAGVFSLHVWDAVTGKKVRQLDPPAKQRFVGPFALSPDGARLAAVVVPDRTQPDAPPGTWTVWEVATGRVLSSWRNDEYFLFADWSPDGRHLVHTDYRRPGQKDRIVWRDAASGEQVAVMTAVKGGLGGAVRVAFSRDGRYIASIPDDSGLAAPVSVWEVAAVLRGESPPPVATFTGHGAPLSRVAFSPDGRRLLTAGGGVVKLWDFASGREVLTLRAAGVTLGDAYFSPDGHTIWGGLDEDGRLWGWDGPPAADGARP